MSASKIENHPHFKKFVTLTQSDVGLNLAVAQDLFGSYEVDAGTKLLLRTLAGRDAFDKVLDLGCGYGPIGLWLGAEGGGRREVHLVDRDALALEFARANAKGNGVQGVRVYGSLGYAGVEDRDFDLIASNVPAKAGDEAIAYLLTAAAGQLKPGGLVAVVVIAARSEHVSEVLGSPNIEIVERRGTRSYTVFHFGFRRPRGSLGDGRSDERVYERGKAMFEAAGVTYEMRCAYDVDEFDTLAYHTLMAAELLGDLEAGAIDRVAVLDPGQGHLPVLAAAKLAPKGIVLVGGDLLALSYSRSNLVAGGFREAGIRMVHAGSPPAGDLTGADLVIDVLRAGEPRAALDQRLGRLPRGASVLMAGRSTAVTRAVDAAGALGRTVRTRKRHRGSSAVLLAG